jgi:hypothetical protein
MIATLVNSREAYAGSHVCSHIAGVGIGGTLGGIIVGHFLTRSWQQKQWLLDQRKDEFRELIIGLDGSMRALAERGDFMHDVTPEERAQRARKTSDFYQTVRTRLFTAADMRKLDVEARWHEAVSDYRKESDAEIFDSCYQSLAEDLVKAATSAPSKMRF